MIATALVLLLALLLLGYLFGWRACLCFAGCLMEFWTAGFYFGMDRPARAWLAVFVALMLFLLALLYVYQSYCDSEQEREKSEGR